MSSARNAPAPGDSSWYDSLPLLISEPIIDRPEAAVERSPQSGGVAIVQTAFPGDVILAGALVRSLRIGWPEIPVAIVVRPEAEPLARMMDPEVTVIRYDKRGAEAGWHGLRQVAARLRSGPWSAVLVVQRYLRSALLAHQTGWRWRIGFNAAAVSSLLYTRRVPYRMGGHEIERNHDLLVELSRCWQVDPPPLRVPRFHLSPAGIVEARDVFSRWGSRQAPPPFVALAPGSIWATKRWPLPYWAQLAARLSREGLQVVWIGGPHDRTLCRQGAAESGIGIVTAGDLSWAGSAALLQQARLLVSNDSAPLHLAGAVDCPVVALFGPTVPRFGFGPIGRGSRGVGVTLNCRPCRRHGSRRCPRGHFRCMNELTPDRVAETVTEAMIARYG